MTENFGYYNPTRQMTFCIAEKGRHPNCKKFDLPRGNCNRPCLYFRDDIDGACDNPSICGEAWIASRK